VILMIGLNGSGKTTTSAKLARHLKGTGKTPLLVAADLHRPAAVQQLTTLGGQIDVEVYSEAGVSDGVAVARQGVRRAAEVGAAWAIVDTAGRFQIDEELMSELEKIKKAVSPAETLLVVDAMTGQDAVNAATDFDERIGVTGLVLSKLDGDARGGAALSVVSVTGVPIKFLGTGERVDALEEFFPERLSSRILGMGDMLTLIEKAQANFDEDEAIKLEKKVRQATFDLDDFLGQLQQLKKMGSIGQIMDMIPGMSSVNKKLPTGEIDDNQIVKIEAVIHSMTPYERSRPEIIGGSRRRRIARGSGTTAQDVNQLLNQFTQTRKLMQKMSTGNGLKDITRMFQ
jgi:signal recognition particle subunit SRP54